LVKQIPQARFFVLNEFRKTSGVIIDNFNQTGNFGTLDVDEMLQQIFYDASIVGAEGQLEKEKEAFYNKYFKNGFLLKPVIENGKQRFKIECHKK
jgi:hypothetical protein